MPRVSASALIPVRLSSFCTTIRPTSHHSWQQLPGLVRLLRWAPVFRGVGARRRIDEQPTLQRRSGFAQSRRHRVAYAASMVRRLRVDVRLATQVLVLQLAVVTFTLGIAGGLLAYPEPCAPLAAQYETQSLTPPARLPRRGPANVARWRTLR